jgi:hypothetical protein
MIFLPVSCFTKKDYTNIMTQAYVGEKNKKKRERIKTGHLSKIISLKAINLHKLSH